MPASRSSPCRVAQTRCCSAIRADARSADRGKLLARRQTVVAEHGRTVGQHVDQAGDADHVELVEIACRDRQESHALEQRMARVAGFLQHTRIKGQPRQFTIDEAAWTVGRDGIGHFGIEGVHVVSELFTITVSSQHDGVMPFH
jgi:hypothetical protein